MSDICIRCGAVRQGEHGVIIHKAGCMNFGTSASSIQNDHRIKDLEAQLAAVTAERDNLAERLAINTHRAREAEEKQAESESALAIITAERNEAYYHIERLEAFMRDIELRLESHREAHFTTCPETCHCWDIEAALNNLEDTDE